MKSLLRPQSELSDPFPLYRQMREECPLFHDRQADIWMIFRHEDCQRLLSSAQTQVPAGNPDGLDAPARDILSHLARLSNGADHGFLRGVAAVVFRECHVLDPAQRLYDLLGSDGELDWVERVARVLPLRLLLEGLGFAPDDRAFLIQAVPILTALMLPRRTEVQVQAINAVAQDSSRIAATRLRELGLVGLDRKAAAANLIGLLIQSYDAGRGLLTNALQQVLARGWPKDIRSFVIETLRFDPPIHNTRRLLTASMRFGDVDIPAGSMVLAVVAAANRDPARFADPECFDPARPNNGDHLTFGIGAHRCLADHYMVNEVARVLTALRHAWPDVMVLPGDDAVEPLGNARLLKRLPVLLQPG